MTIGLAGSVMLALLVAVPANAAEFRVTMAGIRYAPPQIAARVGDVIAFVNDDTVDHEVFVPTANFGIDFGSQKPGATVQMPLGKEGTFDVECVFHPHMLMKVSVAK